MLRLAIYDMDKTITRRATWTPFLIHAARSVAPWRLLLLPAAVLATAGYALRLVSRAGLKEATQRLMLGRAVSPERLRRIAASFADSVAETGTFHGARARIAADRREGYRIVLATASYGFYAAEIAARLDIVDVIATRWQTDSKGHILSRIEGENCYGPVKLRMIENWLESEGIARDAAHVRFYSDHVSDAPALAWADEAYAVNAHGPLRELAGEKGWTILDWD